MSGSTEEVITRRPRGERPQREVHREEPQQSQAVVVDVSPDDGISPVDALAETRRQLQDNERRLADERRLRQEADRRAQQATQQATAARHTDRQVVLQSAITGAEGEIASAEAAYRSARDAGDVDAEIAASRSLAAATARLDRAASELEWAKNQPKPADPAQPSNAPSSEAQAWLDAHPAYFSDDEYQAMAHVGDKRAQAAGHKAGSQSYVDYIEKFMTDRYGEGHGQLGGEPKPMTTRQRDRSNDLAPTRRATPGGNTGGYKRATIGNLGNIEYRQESDGSRRVRFASKDQRENFEEGATICKMSFDDYVNDQILHAQEIEAGGRGDIIYGDGQRFE